MQNSSNCFRIPNSLISRKNTNESPLSEYRTEFMRDRDRVLYSTAIRRLSGKTQIYTVGIDDHKRNRLTHTLEVVQIARTIAKALNLDEVLSETIALAHDFGHTPFGHEGEIILHNIMIPNSKYIKSSVLYKDKYNAMYDNGDEYYGFKHNIQSVRLLCTLEDSYLDNDGNNIGLNLTNYSLYGIMKHCDVKYMNEDIYPNYEKNYEKLMGIGLDERPAWSFEAYIVKCADVIAQWHHDLEDAVRGDALPLEKICQYIEEFIGGAICKDDKELLESLMKKQSIDRNKLSQLSHVLVNTIINDLITNSQTNMNKIKTIITSDGRFDESLTKKMYIEYDEFIKDRINLRREDVISFSNNISQTGFNDLISSSVHHSQEVERMNAKGQYIIRKLFEAYYSNPQQLPNGPILHFLVDTNTQGFEYYSIAKDKSTGELRTEFDRQLCNIRKNEKIQDKDSFRKEVVLMRRICDHIASMTDHYAIQEYNNLYG